MSLSSMYSSLRYYEGQVRYWNGSAATYQAQLGDVRGQLAHWRTEKGKADTAKTQCDDLTQKESDLEGDFDKAATDLNGAMDASQAAQALKDLYKDNSAKLTSAQTEAANLVTAIQQEIERLSALEATYQEGLDYSNGRARYYSSCASSMRTAIANYDED